MDSVRLPAVLVAFTLKPHDTLHAINGKCIRSVDARPSLLLLSMLLLLSLSLLLFTLVFMMTSAIVHSDGLTWNHTFAPLRRVDSSPSVLRVKWVCHDEIFGFSGSKRRVDIRDGPRSSAVRPLHEKWERKGELAA